MAERANRPRPLVLLRSRSTPVTRDPGPPPGAALRIRHGCRVHVAGTAWMWHPRRSKWSGPGNQAELAHQAEFVQAPPALHDAPVPDPPDVDPGQADGAARCGHPEDLPLLRAARRESLDHQVTLFDKEAQVAVPVGERG